MTQVEKLSQLLLDHKWHSNFELSDKIALRYGDVLFRLKKLGVSIEKRQDMIKKSVWWYRLEPVAYVQFSEPPAKKEPVTINYEYTPKKQLTLF